MNTHVSLHLDLQVVSKLPHLLRLCTRLPTCLPVRLRGRACVCLSICLCPRVCLSVFFVTPPRVSYRHHTLHLQILENSLARDISFQTTTSVPSLGDFVLLYCYCGTYTP